MLARTTMIATMLAAVALAGCSTSGPNCQLLNGETGDGNPLVTIETNFGNITAEIFVDKVWITGYNFVRLSEEGTYDDSPFHRIIGGFMMQGGDHTRGDGRGGAAHPEYANSQGNIPDEFHKDLRHDKRGMFSMANAGANTGSSQFFITFTATPWLNDKHAVFGQVVEGFDVLDQIEEEASSEQANGVPPKVPVTFESASVSCAEPHVTE